MRPSTSEGGPGARAPFFPYPRRPWRLALIAVITGFAPATRAGSDESGQGVDADSNAQAKPEVIVVEGQSEAETLKQSAKTVTVLSTREDQKKSADLGEVLARTQGVGVQRAGGLGSGTRFSLNGLTDDQIRFFLDGVPLEFAGFPLGLANVPVNLVERIEVYRGVVPIEFGADALGGAVNLVSNRLDGSGASASYQIGSFGTHRMTGDAQLAGTESGVFARATAFLDSTENSYDITVDIPDDRGRPVQTEVERFHDNYRASGLNLEVGVTEQDWAEKLSVRGFITDFERDIQTNLVMSVPYGEARFFERVAGATLDYGATLDDTLGVSVVAGYNRLGTRFLDRSDCAYSWLGECVRRDQPGEIAVPASDRKLVDDNYFVRVNASIELAPEHQVRVSLSPTLTDRSGDERLQLNPEARDPLTAERRLVGIVAGAEYEAVAVGGALTNISFIKGYFQRLRSEEPLPGDIFVRRDRDTERLGFGDSLRFALSDALVLRASYEWATRLPNAEEVFGNGVLLLPNLELSPETSHNVNVGVELDERTSFGALAVELNGFLRDSSDLISVLGVSTASSQNVLGARSIGVEGALRWTLPGEWLTLGGNGTYLDLRNNSSEGAFSQFDGDRIPNRPYLFANGSASLRFRGLRSDDTLRLDWDTRFVGSFFFGWESAGARDSKPSIPSQLQHGAAAVYSTQLGPVLLAFSAEVQNITDESLFDFFGAQRPGRSAFFKVSAEWL
ncbi:MAG: TonB-dependent receptor [Myxococcota bacterium]